MASFPAYAVSRGFDSAARLFLHPVIVLPLLVYLLGGTSAQIVWYAVVAGVAQGISAPLAAYIAASPDSARTVLAVLLVVQAAGFLGTALVAFLAGTVASETLLRVSAIAYLLLVIPSSMIVRLAEHGYEYRKPAASSIAGVLPSILGVLLAVIAIFAILRTDTLGPDNAFARVILAGGLCGSAGVWLASYRTLFASQLPYPAHAMPSVRSPRLGSNNPLTRFAGFQLLHGLARFADPFILIALVTLVRPDVVWLGAAVIAFGVGAVVASLTSIHAWSGVNVRPLFVASETLHTIALLTAAFLPTVMASSLIADRRFSSEFQNGFILVIGFALGASYLLARDGHRAYVRSISTPQTRDVSLVIIGAVVVVTAFAPLIAVQLLESWNLDTLLQIAFGVAIIAMLATALIVPPYSPPRRRRNAWNMRSRT